MDSNQARQIMGYDVFFSYNSQDQGTVEEVARRLQIQQVRKREFPVIPILLPGCEPPLGFLSQNTWIDQRSQPIDQTALVLEKSIRGEAMGPDIQAQFAATKNAICPYRGFLCYREEDASFFFGRDAAIAELQKTVDKASFVGVVGASGSGKSSVVRAGLVPRMRKQSQPVWSIASLVPGDEPLKALASSIVPFLYPEPELDVVDRCVKANSLAVNLHADEGYCATPPVCRRIAGCYHSCVSQCGAHTAGRFRRKCFRLPSAVRSAAGSASESGPNDAG